MIGILPALLALAVGVVLLPFPRLRRVSVGLLVFGAVAMLFVVGVVVLAASSNM